VAHPASCVLLSWLARTDAFRQDETITDTGAVLILLCEENPCFRDKLFLGCVCTAHSNCGVVNFQHKATLLIIFCASYGGANYYSCSAAPHHTHCSCTAEQFHVPTLSRNNEW
jgi:hypothetical protein